MYGQPPGSEARAAAVPSAQKTVSLGVLLGYGVSFEDFNPWAAALGLTAGVNLSSFYLGARFAYHFGETVTDGFSDIKINLWELNLVVGYDIAVIQNLSLRPNASVGLATIMGEGTGEFEGSDSSEELMLAAGLAAIYDIQPSVFLGLDLRIEHIFGDVDANGFVFSANGGVRF
jgi:hypothetical protein